MKKLKKVITFTLILLTCFSSICAEMYFETQVVNDSQVLKENHWIYQDFKIIFSECRISAFFDVAPISVGELKFYLKQIDYEKLSLSGQNLYDKIYNFLYNQPKATTKYNIGLRLNPEFYLTTNKDIESSIRYFYKDWPATLPVIIGIADNFALQADFFYGKHFYSSIDSSSITNIPFKMKDGDGEFPKFAYGNMTWLFNNWGIAAQIGKEGFRIGETQLGSVIYNSTFETDAYSVFSAFTEKFKYDLIFSQVNYDRFLYLHTFNINFFPNLKITLTEGGLREGPIELRFFNPIMLVHSFFPAKDYERDLNEKYDLDNHYCAYFGITLDYYPIPNLRLYGLWSQTENQSKSELASGNYGKLLPNGYGLQLGADFNYPSKHGGFYIANIEGLYTSPFLYVKQSPNWSLVKYRFDLNHQKKDVASWIGSPFGPDTFALTTSFGYKQPEKWSAKFSYLLVMKGEIDADTLLTTSKPDQEKHPDDQNEYPAYYPAVNYYLGIEDLEDAIIRARDISLTGIVQYTNKFTLSGEFFITPKLKSSMDTSYIFVFNNKHKKDNFQQGFEIKLALTYNIF